MHLDIITPESKVFSGSINSVQFPGLNGSFQVLENHAPIISSLKEGVLKIAISEALNKEAIESLHKTVKVSDSNQSELLVAIKGGVMEMSNNKIIVLAE